MTTRALSFAPLALLALLACHGGTATNPPVIHSFTVDKTSLTASGPVTLSWSAEGATSLTLSPDLGAVDGGSLTTKVWVTTNFTLLAENGAGKTTASVKVQLVTAPLTTSVDGSLKPGMDSLGDARTVVASVDGSGTQTDFVLGEARFSPRSKDELDGFLSRTGSTVVSTDVPPAPTPGGQVDPKFSAPTEYVVRFDASRFDVATLAQDGQNLGIGGTLRFSSDLAQRHFAQIAHEAVTGLRVHPNYVTYDQELLLHTQERPEGLSGTWDDAFDNTKFSYLQATGSGASVLQAWQWLHYHGIVRRTKVAIIDDGFWLDPSGKPYQGTYDGSDLPDSPAQYNFANGTYFAGGTNAGTCTGGSVCHWHGNGSAGTAVGAVDNRAAAAGSGGTVADPILFKSNHSQDSTHDAVRTAIAWGADVVNISSGAACNIGCRQLDRDDPVYSQAAAAGVIVVASAGNDNHDVNADGYFFHPCINDGVLCVGALNDQQLTRISYSNYGGQVDLWAPTNIRVMPNGDNPGSLASHGGTSASAPFVAGIVAMMKAVNPALTFDQTLSILQSTAWTNSPDANVKWAVNAFKAVKAVSNGVLPADREEPNDSPSQATPISLGAAPDLALSTPTDHDNFRIDVSSLANVNVTVTYPSGIGSPSLVSSGLSSTQGCQFPLILNDATAPDQRTLSYRLPTGHYQLALSSSQEFPYDLSIAQDSAGALVDAWEPNNSFVAPAKPPTSDLINGVISPSGDEDYFQIHSPGSFSTADLSFGSAIAVDGTDIPLTLSLYTTGGALLSTSTGTSDCSTLPSLLLPNEGDVVVGVRAADGTSIGAYSLSLLVEAKQHPKLGQVSIILGQRSPGDPYEHIVTKNEEWIEFQQVTDFPTASIQLISPDMHLTLFDADGNQLSEGQKMSFANNVGETATVTPVHGQALIAHIQREAEPGALAPSTIPESITLTPMKQ